MNILPLLSTLGTIALVMLFIFYAFVLPNSEARRFAENEIPIEGYQALATMTEHYPPLKIWLANQLKEKRQFTGADYVEIKAYLEQAIKDYDEQAVKLSILKPS